MRWGIGIQTQVIWFLVPLLRMRIRDEMSESWTSDPGFWSLNSHFFFKSIFLKIFIFIFREGEGEREGEKHRCAVRRLALNLLSHTIQCSSSTCFHSFIHWLLQLVLTAYLSVPGPKLGTRDTAVGQMRTMCSWTWGSSRKCWDRSFRFTWVLREERALRAIVSANYIEGECHGVKNRVFYPQCRTQYTPVTFVLPFPCPGLSDTILRLQGVSVKRPGQVPILLLTEYLGQVA